MRRDRRPERGFTLVEVLIALSIFGMLSVAGVSLLRASITTQASVTERLSETSQLLRLRALLASELIAAQPRPNRDASGTAQPALTGSETVMAVIHSSDGDRNSSDSSVGRATYWLDGDRIVRDGAQHIDGVAPGTPATMVRDVAALRWRYRSADGTWNAVWAPDRPDRLPRAVELTLERSGGGAPLTMVFAVAPDGLPPPGSSDAEQAP